MKVMELKLGSLFDGSGTCPLAASAVGITPAWASEIEPFPKAVTESRFPNMVHLGDITKLDGILYLVRKLTPTECASLQGFEKDWCALVEHKDAPEYKMWGNGMAFPCVLYVMEGIAEVLQRRYLESLFGGSPDG